MFEIDQFLQLFQSQKLLSIIPKGIVHTIDPYAVVLGEFSSRFF